MPIVHTTYTNIYFIREKNTITRWVQTKNREAWPKELNEEIKREKQNTKKTEKVVKICVNFMTVDVSNYSTSTRRVEGVANH